jgi:hypothetical protein
MIEGTKLIIEFRGNTLLMKDLSTVHNKKSIVLLMTKIINKLLGMIEDDSFRNKIVTFIEEDMISDYEIELLDKRINRTSFNDDYLLYLVQVLNELIIDLNTNKDITYNCNILERIKTKITEKIEYGS